MSNPRLSEIEVRAAAYPLVVKGMAWVHPVEDVPALTAAIRAVLAIEPPFADEFDDADVAWNDALTGYRTALRAALAAHLDLS